MSEPPRDRTLDLLDRVRSEVSLSVRGLWKTYLLGNGSELHVLRGVDFSASPGESVAIVGTSGAGKSTFLHLLGALDRPTKGEIQVAGTPLANRTSLELAQIRNRFVGFVFQFHHLLREFSALENVMMPNLILGKPRAEAAERARSLLGAVGLSGRLDHRPWQLSGGEQQRVAVARALVNDPMILLADEPTGNLDSRTSRSLHDLLFELSETMGCTMVLVTHNLELAARAHRTLHLDEGVLSDASEG